MVERFSFGSIPSTLFAHVLWVTCAVCCGCVGVRGLVALISGNSPRGLVLDRQLVPEMSPGEVMLRRSHESQHDFLMRRKKAHSEGKPHRAVPNFGPTLRPS